MRIACALHVVHPFAPIPVHLGPSPGHSWSPRSTALARRIICLGRDESELRADGSLHETVQKNHRVHPF